jgi:NAD(P)-dependent dehydrogenase (short-subunit alcohol dehydrogenase family)
MQLAGKVAIVTGGGKGIGRYISLAFAREGADVVVASRTESALKEVAKEIEASGRKSLPVVIDLADFSHPEILIDKAMDKFGKIDILVNNSGAEGPVMNVSDMDLAGWNEMMAVNLTGAMLCAKYALVKSMIPRKSGAIINLSSVAGRQGPPMRSAYSSSKFAVIGFTQSLAMEVGKSGIRVNAIAPGATEGERIQRIGRIMAELTGNKMPQGMSTGVRVALGRMVKPEEVANLAVFLASDQSSAITGQCINCDAGQEFN